MEATCKQVGISCCYGYGMSWTLCRLTVGPSGTTVVKEGLAQMLKGGIIMDVVSVEHARIAEEAGACAVMALERVPADIRKEGGVARMTDPKVSVIAGVDRYRVYTIHVFCSIPIL